MQNLHGVMKEIIQSANSDMVINSFVVTKDVYTSICKNGNYELEYDIKVLNICGGKEKKIVCLVDICGFDYAIIANMDSRSYSIMLYDENDACVENVDVEIPFGFLGYYIKEIQTSSNIASAIRLIGC